MPKFSAYMKGADGSMGPPGASIIDGVVSTSNFLPVPNQNKYAFLVGTTTPKHLWVWNENNPNENKWEDQGTTASMLEEVSASITTIPWTTTAIPSITTQFSTSNQLDYINFDFTIPEGQPAGFGEVSITTQRLSYTTHPTASISTDGENWEKNFHFGLGIPEGAPAGFSTYQPTSVSTLEWDAPATVEVINITTTPNDNKSFNFKFGVPQGRAAGFSTFSANIESVGWTEDPTVSISESGPNWGKNIEFDFKVPKTRPAGFGTSSNATAVTTAWDTQPQISVSTDGEDWEKNFHFGFEIPVGRPAGFGDINVTTSTLEANSNPWVKVNSVTDSPEYEKDFNFEFGLPKGIAAGFSTGQYVSVSTLETGEQAVVEITTITTSPETAKEFSFHFGLPKGDALAIYDGITFTSTEDGIDYHWKYEQGTTTLVFNRGTVSKLPIYIYNDNNRSIASTFKISTSTIEYNADEPFDGTMYLMMPATLQEVEVGTVSSTTYGYEPVISRSTGSTSTKVIFDFIIPEGYPGHEVIDSITTNIELLSEEIDIKFAPMYGVCASGASDIIKTVTIPNFTLVVGRTIFVKFQNSNSASNPTLNVSNTGAKSIYRYGTTAASTTSGTNGWQAGAILALTYDGTGWVEHYWYNNTYALANNAIGSGHFTADSVVYRYQLLVHTDREHLSPFNNDNNITATTKIILTNLEFDPFEQIYYYDSTTNISAGALISGGSLYYSKENLDLRYTFNINDTTSPLTLHKDVYMKVIPQSNGKVKLASAMPLVQELPSTNDGYWYIFLGRATTHTYGLTLYPDKPVFYHDGSGIRQKFNPYLQNELDSINANIELLSINKVDNIDLNKILASMGLIYYNEKLYVNPD